MISGIDFCNKFKIPYEDFNNKVRTEKFKNYVSSELIKTLCSDGRRRGVYFYNEPELMLWVQFNQPEWLKSNPELDKPIRFDKDNLNFKLSEYSDPSSLEREALVYMERYPYSYNDIAEKKRNIDYISFICSLVIKHQRNRGILIGGEIFGSMFKVDIEQVKEKLEKIKVEDIINFLKKQRPYFWRRYTDTYLFAAIAYLVCFGSIKETGVEVEDSPVL